MTGVFPPKEKDVQRAVVALYEAVGGFCYSTSVYRPGGAKIAAGIPDLIILWPNGRGTWFHEVKAPKGKQTDGQVLFERRCVEAGTPYIVGGEEEAKAALRIAGILL